MADKSRCGPELTEAEIHALVDNSTPKNTKEELLILEFLIKQLFYSGIQPTRRYAPRWLSITSYPARPHRIIIISKIQLVVYYQCCVLIG